LLSSLDAFSRCAPSVGYFTPAKYKQNISKM